MSLLQSCAQSESESGLGMRLPGLSRGSSLGVRLPKLCGLGMRLLSLSEGCSLGMGLSME